MFNKFKSKKFIFNWIYSRVYVLAAILLDSLLFYIFIENSFNDIYLNNINLVILILPWIILSYIIGRYSDYDNNPLNNFSNQMFKLIILYFYLNVYKIIFFRFFNISNSNYVFTNLNKYYFFYSSISLILLLLINLIMFRNKNKQKIIFFIGPLKDYDILKDNLLLKKENHILYKIDINKLDTFFSKVNSYHDKLLLIISNKYNISDLELDFLKNIKKENIEVIDLMSWLDKEYQLIPSNLLSDIELFTGKSNIKNNPIEIRLKRVGDIFISAFLLLFLSPLIIVAAIFIYLEDGSPIFYSQIRSGLNQKRIKIYKLRTMNKNAEINGAQWSKKNDKRLTNCGMFLRRTRIDELPQLLSVIAGEMSLIGPRPERPQIEEDLKKIIPYYDYRYLIKPGLSGWAQVNYPYGASIKDSKIKLSYDLYYIKNYSFFLDFLIFLKTIKLVLNAKGAIAKK